MVYYIGITSYIKKRIGCSSNQSSIYSLLQEEQWSKKREKAHHLTDISRVSYFFLFSEITTAMTATINVPNPIMRDSAS